jgi:nitrogen fixation-related uncharacterized protein
MDTYSSNYIIYIGIAIFLVIAIIAFFYFTKKNFSFDMVADNELSILHNGKSVYSNPSLEWNKGSHIGSLNVKQGDLIEFVVKNRDSIGGLIGQFTYNGKTYYTTTDVFKDKIVEPYLMANTSEVTTKYPNSKWLWVTPNCQNCNVSYKWTVV